MVGGWGLKWEEDDEWVEKRIEEMRTARSWPSGGVRGMIGKVC